MAWTKVQYQVCVKNKPAAAFVRRFVLRLVTARGLGQGRWCVAGEKPMNKNHGNGHDKSAGGKGRKLRSLEWFNNPHNPGMTALYLERYLNYGLTREELQSGKPIIGIAQTGNDLSPCNRHHLDLAK